MTIQHPSDLELATRERILRTTSRLVLSHGYAGTSTRAIAAEVGIRQPSLFHHFDSKRAIVRELLDRDLGPALQRARHFAELPGSAAARLFAYVAVDLRSLDAWPYDVRSIYTTELLDDPDFIEQRHTYDQMLALLRRIVDDALASGQLRDVKPAHIQQAIGGVFLAAIWAPAMVRDAELQDWPEAAAEILLRGLLRDPATFEYVQAIGDRMSTDAARADP